MTPLAFAWRSLTRERARASLGVAGVAIVGALLFDMLLLSRGLVLSFRDVLLQTGFDLRVTATKALPGTGPPIEDASKAVADLRRLPEVGSVVPMRFGPGWARENGTFVQTAVVGTAGRESREWRILEGRGLSFTRTDPPEVEVNEELARALDLAPGSELTLHPGTLRSSVLPPTRFRVVGIATFPFEAKGQSAVRMSFDAFGEARFGADRDEADMLLVSSKPPFGPDDAAAAMRRARPDLDSFSVYDLLDRFRRTDFTYFRQISFALSTVAAFFASLLVTTLVTVSVNQRLGEIASLRALGFSRARVCLDLVAESLLLLGAGGLAALPLGAAVAWILDGILRGFPGLPRSMHFFVPDLRAVALLGAILLGSALLAAAYPVWIAARLEVATTLRKEIVS